jgi:putative ABC transport system ATP-binding protein
MPVQVELHFLEVQGVTHAYPNLPPIIEVGSLHIRPGESVAITGPSGSGKTTLLNLLTGIEPVRQGTVQWGAVELGRLLERERDRWRRENVGFVFQDFHLVPGLSIEDNVLVASFFDRWRPSPEQRHHARELLRSFGVPTQRRRLRDLSRGEQQRVAIARALLRTPRVLVADEPTASLDAGAGAKVIDLLLRTVREAGTTFLAVTHDRALIDAVDSVYALQGGRPVRVR